MKLSKFKAPNTFFIIFSLTALIALLTWILPAGVFERILVDGKEVVDGDSFHYVERNPQGFSDLFMAPIKGFVGAAQIIGFVMIVGGAFSVFQKTKAVDSAIKAIAKAYNKSRIIRNMLIPVFMLLFSAAGAVFGMSEEIIPFILIFVPMALVLGYDSITGVAIPFLGAGAGFAGAFLNPFTVGIAQGIAELPPFSGMEYRIFAWAVITITAITFVSLYAKKIKKNPEKSLTYEQDKIKKENLHIEDIEKFENISKRHKLVLGVFGLALLVLVYGVLQYQWFINEICGLFFIIGIVVGIVGKLSIKETTDAFVEGAKALIGTALIIALARGILVIATDGKIIDTILYNLSLIVKEVHPIVSSQSMFIIQSFINFFVPSGSGQAALTMPIMAPLGDLVGVSRQTAVLAFQFGDGFSNMIIPTSAVTMGVLTLAEIPWEKWARWILPLQILFMIIGLLLLIPPFFIHW